MSRLFNIITKSKYYGRVFDDNQLSEILTSTAASRYALVNRALKDETLIRIKRGLYALNDRNQIIPNHPFVIAQSMVPASYISFESALSYYGLIPEAVYSYASVTPRRKTMNFNVEKIGHFSFHPIATNRYEFLKGVTGEKFGELSAFIAKPLRAIMDIVAVRKLEWSGIEWLFDGLRIDNSWIYQLNHRDFHELRETYMHKKAKEFLHEFEKAVFDLRSQKKVSRDND